MDKYYNGGKLLNMTDLNGNKPEIFIVAGNRSAGKTTYFSRKIVRDFINDGKQFILLYRYNYQTENCESSFFGNLQTFFPDQFMTAKNRMRGAYRELFLNKKTCGYAIALNKSDVIKTISSMFYNVEQILFDEFQTEGSYCDNEISKFISVHMSVARGHGKQSRYVPVYMCSNFSSLLNPYYATLGISERLRTDTKFMRGNGWAIEINKNKHAIDEQTNSIFMSAFKDALYYKHAIDNMYMNDNVKFIENISGNNNYLCTIKYNGELFSLREYHSPHVLYVSNSIDPQNPRRISVTDDDLEQNYVMKQQYSYLVTLCRNFYQWGLVRFQNLNSKNAFIKFASY